MFSSGSNFYSFFDWLHQNIYFIDILFSWCILVYFFTKKDFLKILKVFVVAFCAILIVPAFDLLYNFGNTFNISYIYERHLSAGTLIERFFTFGGSFENGGISLGLKIAAFVLISFIFYYTFLKTKSFLKSLLCSIFAYIILFCNAIIPFFISYNKENFDQNFSLFFYILFLVQVSVILYILKKETFLIIVKDFRLIRIFNYIVIFFFGAIIFDRTNAYSFFEDTKSLALMLISFLFAAFFATINNNINDIDIDKISNKEREYIKKNVNISEYQKASVIFFVLSTATSFFVGFWFTYIISLLMLLYFVYSTKPFRFRNNLFFSKTVLAFNFLITMVAGNYFVEGKIFFSYPLFIILFLIFWGYLNFIDLKDYEGDRKNGVKNVVTVFGLSRSKKIIASFFVISFLLSNILIFNLIFLILSIVFSVMQWIFVNKKIYKEAPVFINYMFFLILFIVFYVFFSDITFEYFYWNI